MGKKTDQSNDPWKSEGVAKLQEVFKRIFGITVSPQRQIAAAKTNAKAEIIEAKGRAEARIIEAKGYAAVRTLEARTEMRIQVEQLRQQQNIEAIMATACDVLSETNEAISDEPVSDDFIARFFDESKNISDEQMQMLWGRLLAGEIAQPGSFEPRVLSIVRDMTKHDAELFCSLCRFSFIIGVFTPVVFNVEDNIYLDLGINFKTLAHLDDMGLLKFNSLGTFYVNSCDKRMISYGDARFYITLSSESSKFKVGKVMLSAAGQQIARLSNANIIPEFSSYAVEKWHALGATVTLLDEQTT